MRRRTFLLCLSCAVAATRSAEAQTSSAQHKIGYLHPATIDPGSSLMSVLRPRWRQLGYVEGKTILLRSAQGDITRLPGLVAELIGLGVDVLIVVGPQAVRAARATTSTTPIVALDLETDPVRAGFIASWTKPGGNMTGLFLDQASLAGKWLAMLREIAPHLRRVALMWDPNTGSDQLDAAKSAARALGIDALVLEVNRCEGIEAALATLGTESTTGVMLLGSPVLINPPHYFADAALKFKLPTVSFFKPIAKAGGLMTYGANEETYFPRSIVMAQEILNGAKPSNMPIERPDHYELIINLKTAKALGLNVPQTLQVMADEVIE
jgi:putative tryptophan/tyrosine transport system substrate-binding protein